MDYQGELLIYQGNENQPQVEVRLNEETIWMTQKGMASLFGIQRPAITKHLSNIFKSKELKESLVSSILEHTAKDRKVYATKYYNLDAVLSVGYRVSSSKATKFRQWATQRLKDYLVKGYALNEQRLQASEQQLTALRQSMKLLDDVMKQKQLSTEEAVGLLKVVTSYARALTLLDQYDHQQLAIPIAKKAKLQKLTYQEAITQINLWRDKQKAGRLFGNEKDQSFHSSLQTIYQTFDGAELYPSLHEKAANLLYFIVKNHSFSDGNKRIAAGLFLYFLDKNKALYAADGSKTITDNTLVAITIMIAESKPDDKEIMIKLIVNLMTNK